MRRDILAGKYDGENKLPSELALARRLTCWDCKTKVE